MKRRWVYLVIATFLVAGAVATTLYLRPWEGATQSDGESRTATVARGGILVVVSASGSIEAERAVALSFEAPGRVEEVAVEVGRSVEAGELLARADSRQLELQVRQAQSSLALVRAQLEQLKAGPRPADIAAAEANLRVAQAQLQAAEARRDQTVSGISSAQIAQAEAQLANALLQRKSVLISHDRVVHGNSSEEDKEKARYDLYVADKAVEAAQARLDELLAGVDQNELRASQAGISSAEAQVQAAQAQLDLVGAGATSEQIADVEAQVVQAEAAVALAEKALEGTRILAPFSGVVTRVDVQVGDLATPGVQKIVLLDESQLHVTVRADENDVGQLSPGQEVAVVLDALADVDLPGYIQRISPVATFEGGIVYYSVRIDLAPTQAPVRVDMSATATVLISELVDVLQVPTWIVRVDRATGQTYVHRRVGEVTERVDVDLGLRYEGTAQVLGGLSEGDVLVWVDEPLPFGLGGS